MPYQCTPSDVMDLIKMMKWDEIKGSLLSLACGRSTYAEENSVEQSTRRNKYLDCVQNFITEIEGMDLI